VFHPNLNKPNPPQPQKMGGKWAETKKPPTRELCKWLIFICGEYRSRTGDLLTARVGGLGFTFYGQQNGQSLDGETTQNARNLNFTRLSLMKEILFLKMQHNLMSGKIAEVQNQFC